MLGVHMHMVHMVNMMDLHVHVLPTFQGLIIIGLSQSLGHRFEGTCLEVRWRMDRNMFHTRYIRYRRYDVTAKVGSSTKMAALGITKMAATPKSLLQDPS